MGKLIWLMGPSGSGKDSLLAELRQQEPAQLLVAHRYITRAANAGNENHIALSEQEFFTRAGQNLLALSWHANGFYYGVGVEIDLWLHAGFDVVVNGSRAHLPQAQARYGTSLLPICLQVSPRFYASACRLVDGRAKRKSPPVLSAQPATPRMTATS